MKKAFFLLAFVLAFTGYTFGQDESLLARLCIQNAAAAVAKPGPIVDDPRYVGSPIVLYSLDNDREIYQCNLVINLDSTDIHLVIVAEIIDGGDSCKLIGFIATDTNDDLPTEDISLLLLPELSTHERDSVATLLAPLGMAYEPHILKYYRHNYPPGTRYYATRFFGNDEWVVMDFEIFGKKGNIHVDLYLNHEKTEVIEYRLDYCLPPENPRNVFGIRRLYTYLSPINPKDDMSKRLLVAWKQKEEQDRMRRR